MSESSSSTRGAKSNNDRRKRTVANGQYVVLEEIGRGAFGKVYKAMDQREGLTVAIKEIPLEGISEDDLNGIMKEIDLMKRLSHTNIVKYLSSARTENYLYIVLEYVENGSLSNVIRPSRFGAFPESLVVLYISQVLEGLVYLHEQGVIHRDIKGANILTTKQGLVKLADFGVSTRLEGEIGHQNAVGSPYWMAPEVIEMKGISTLSDIWSVGCTTIELLTSQPPYYELQPVQALFKIVQDQRPPLPQGISDLLQDFLKQCFQKNPKRRPSAKDLLEHPWIRKVQNDLKRSWPRTKKPPIYESAEEGPQQHAQQSSSMRTVDRSSEDTSTLAQNGVTPVIQRMLESEGDHGQGSSLHSSHDSEQPNTEQEPAAGRRLASWLETISSENKADAVAKGDSMTTGETSASVKETAKVLSYSGDEEYDAEVRRLVASLKPDKRGTALVETCDKLSERADGVSEVKATQVAMEAARPLTSLLEHDDVQVQEAALKVLEKFANSSESVLFHACLLGPLPSVARLCASGNPGQVRLLAARIILQASRMKRTLEMLLACQACPLLVELIEEDYRGTHVKFVQYALEMMMNILSLQEGFPTETDAFLQLLAASKLPERLTKAMESMTASGEEDLQLSEKGNTNQHMEQACRLLLEVSQGHGECIDALSKSEVLSRIVHLVSRVSLDFSFSLLEVLKYVSQHDRALEPLDRVGAIQALVPFLSGEVSPKERSFKPSGGHERGEKQQVTALFTLGNLCKGKKTRQEKAALAGAVSPLVELSRRGGVYESTAVSVLCGMAHASRRTRSELWRHGALERLMECLDDERWRLQSLEAVVSWLTWEPTRVEPVLLQKNQLERLAEVLCGASDSYVVKVMDLLSRLVKRAPRVTAALARGRMGKKLVQYHLHNRDVSISLQALKLLKAMYESHPSHKELAAALDLQSQLRSLTSSGETQSAVLARQLAQQLLSALQVNSFI